MSRFVQLHLLTTYPPSNPNRDDLGRPKTARFGNAERMRISSQALKRAIRTSESFREALAGHMGQRTQRIGRIIHDRLLEKGADEERAMEIARKVADVFGKVKKEKADRPLDLEQLAFVSPEERERALEWAERMLAGEDPDDNTLKKEILRHADGAADIAMFGRMLADDPHYNREAAVQIAHAITTNRVEVESDFYTAVDDLKVPEEDAGAGFVGELGFGSGVFYIYACVDRDLLMENLGGDERLASAALGALVHALATSSPGGKKNSFAHGGRAQYILVEKGNQQPRTLAAAFLKPVHDEDLMRASIERLEKFREEMGAAYGACADEVRIMRVGTPQSATLEDIAGFCASAVGGA